MKRFNTEKSKKITPIKIIIIGFIFVAIGFAIHLKMKKSDRVASLKQASSSFALLDTSAIDKIIIFNGKEVINLSKNVQHKWLYNGIASANQPAITELLQAMLLLKPLKTVKESDMDKEAIDLRTNGIKVQFYAGEIEDRAFYVNNASNATPTKMMMVSSGAPYFIVCEGYDDKVNQLFSVTSDHWKTLKFFNSTASSIQSIESKSSQLPAFTLQYDAGFFKLNPKDEILSKDAVNDYFNQILALEMDAYVGMNQADESAIPLATLSLTDVDAKRNNQLEVLKIESTKALIRNSKGGKCGYISKEKLAQLFPVDFK